MKKSDTGMLRLIAVFKLLKAALLIAVGIGVLKYLHKELSCALEHWIAMMGLNPGNRLLDRALEKAANLTPHKIKLVGVGSFIYAGLFLVEGTGLWLAKRWGEWVTIIITSSLLPIEVYECYHHLTAIKILVLLINVAVVFYLVHRIRKHDTLNGTRPASCSKTSTVLPPRNSRPPQPLPPVSESRAPA